MNQHKWKRLCQRLAPAGIILALGLGFLIVRGSPGWLVLLLLAAWAVFLLGNLVIYGGQFLRGSSWGEKWFAAVLLVVLVGWILCGVFGR